MKTTSFWLALLFCLALAPVRADDSKVTYGGGDGSTMKAAIVILGAKNETEGVHAEYTYLAGHSPGYKLIRQSLLNQDRKDYDLLEFTASDGSAHTIYFDITDYFGKL